MKRIELTHGQVAIVDDCDHATLARWKWRAVLLGRTWYAARTDSRGVRYQRYILMHRQILNVESDVQVDHRDGDGLNNRRGNLRRASSAQNNQNRRKRAGCSSRYKGVCWDKERNKWKADIKQDGRRRCLGRFNSERKAAEAYDAAARKLFGAFAHCNFTRRI